jgi:hypothetical protein
MALIKGDQFQKFLLSVTMAAYQLLDPSGCQ